MKTITIDKSNISGKVKCLNAVNNGPKSPGVRQSRTNFHYYKAAGISYARNHDASFYTPYGGEHIVDVHRIFKNFDADVNDPASYVFAPTDSYLKNTIDAGTKVFYRLGASIEHGYKYGTYPPEDYQKWAEICEHIIMHYTRGWADGFNWDIEYWEIWNEPDMYHADGSNPCWQSTIEEFAKLYITAASHLKSKFPHLKIGGPAFCTAWVDEYKTKFFEMITEAKAPLDFYSYHCYKNYPEYFAESVDIAKATLEQYGYRDAELILNEWNYVKGWAGDDWNYSIDSIRGLKGASFEAAVMSVTQRHGIDMLMYYDARPCTMNGIFNDYTFEPLKGYYPLVMAGDIMSLGNYIVTDDDTNLYSVASADGIDTALMFTYYNDDELPCEDIRLSFKNTGITDMTKVSFYLLDEDNDMTHVKDEYVSTDSFDLYVKAKEYSVYFVKIENKASLA